MQISEIQGLIMQIVKSNKLDSKLTFVVDLV